MINIKNILLLFSLKYISLFKIEMMALYCGVFFTYTHDMYDTCRIKEEVGDKGTDDQFKEKLLDSLFFKSTCKFHYVKCTDLSSQLDEFLHMHSPM